MSLSESIIEDGECRVVLDNGSYMVRAGYAGEENPYSEIMTITSCENNEDWHVGEAAKHRRGIKSKPITDGMIEDFEGMKKIWSFIFDHELKFKTKNMSLLVADCPMNPKIYREKMLEEFFEYYAFGRVSIQLSPVLAIFSSSCLTGLSLDVGLDSYSLVSVIEGHSDLETNIKVNLGGSDINKHLLKILNEKGINLYSEEGFHIVEDLKKTKCFLTYDQRKVGEQNECVYELPDGQKLEIGQCVSLAPECLFKPSLFGREELDLAEYCRMAIDSHSSKEIQGIISKNIFLSGSTVKLKGFEQRLFQEINREQIRIPRQYAPNHNIWTGGSIFASTITLENNSITHRDYEEKGPFSIHQTIL